MRYADIQNSVPAKFKRLTGVSPQTFEQMLDVLKRSWRDFGRPPKLAREDQLLLALSYWREYRSLAHIAATYQVSEPTVSRTIRRVEDTLRQSGISDTSERVLPSGQKESARVGHDLAVRSHR